MKSFKIEVVETNTYKFDVSAETEAEARAIVDNGWMPAWDGNGDCLKDTDVNIIVFNSEATA